MIDWDLRGHGLRVTPNIGMADLFVVTDPATTKVSCAWRWGAVLRGGYCIAPSVLTSGAGPCLKFKCALQTRRRLFVSRRFRVRHAGVWEVINIAISSPVSRWTLVTRAAYIARRAARPTDANLFALTVSSDVELLTMKDAFVAPRFLDRIAVADELRTCSGR